MVNLAKVNRVEKNAKGRVILNGGQSLSLELLSKEVFIEKLMGFNKQKNQ